MPCARVYRLTPFFEIRLALSAWARRDQLTSAEPEPDVTSGLLFGAGSSGQLGDIRLGLANRRGDRRQHLPLGETRLAYDYLIIGTGAGIAISATIIGHPQHLASRASRTHSTFAAVFCLPSRPRRAARARRSDGHGLRSLSSVAVRPASN